MGVTFYTKLCVSVFVYVFVVVVVVCVCGGDINPIKCPTGVAFYAKGGKEGIFSLKCSKSITAKYSQTSMARTPLGP